VREHVGQDLDRDLPPELRIASAVYLAHSACAEHAQDLERAESLARGEGHPRLVFIDFT
jgi:hypothetical protein